MTTTTRERKRMRVADTHIPAATTDQELISQWLSRRARSQHPLCQAALGALRHQTRAQLARVTHADIDAAVEAAGDAGDQKARRKALANLFHLVVGAGWRSDNPAEEQPDTPTRTALIWRDRQPHGALVDSGIVAAWDWTKTRAEIDAMVSADQKTRKLARGATRREYEVVEL